jgi:hypothetical protein
MTVKLHNEEFLKLFSHINILGMTMTKPKGIKLKDVNPAGGGKM